MLHFTCEKTKGLPYFVSSVLYPAKGGFTQNISQLEMTQSGLGRAKVLFASYYSYDYMLNDTRVQLNLFPDMERNILGVGESSRKC